MHTIGLTQQRRREIARRCLKEMRRILSAQERPMLPLGRVQEVAVRRACSMLGTYAQVIVSDDIEDIILNRKNHRL